MIISATERPISGAGMIISAIDTSFFGAEISIAAAEKASGGVCSR